MRKKILSMILALAFMFCMAPVAAFAEDDEAKQMQNVSISGVTYFYTNTAGDAEDTSYKGVVRGRQGTTEYPFTKSDLTQVGQTDYYYVVIPGKQPLEGTLYGYGEGNATTYRQIYKDLGVETDESYDVISSATKFTSHHAGDIPTNIVFGTDANDDKAITGLTLGSQIVTVDALPYVEGSIKAKLVGQSSADGVDAVSGATCTSLSLIQAAREALQEAAVSAGQ